jgi:REP element-mobilizing transposase RayT
MAEMARERDELQETDCRDATVWGEMQRRQFARIEAILDKGQIERSWLIEPGVPDVVLDGLKWLEEERGWNTYAAVVMPNHLHWVTRNSEGRNGELLGDLESFKRFTGRRANKSFDRHGEFWARDDFDHWCRSSEKTTGAVEYVKKNPVKAGLCERWEDWPWTVVNYP